MRPEFLAVLAALLVGRGLALAQQCGADSADHPFGPTAASCPAIGDGIVPPGDRQDKAPPHGDVYTQAETFGFRGSGDYVLWWFKNGRVPPLVTAGGDGALGSLDTRVQVDNLNFDHNVREGGRFALGYHFETVPFIGVEAIYFFLADRQADVRFSSSGDPVLGRPFINVATGRPDATLISSPGIAAGTVTVGVRTALSGAEAEQTVTDRWPDTSGP